MRARFHLMRTVCEVKIECGGVEPSDKPRYQNIAAKAQQFKELSLN